MKFLSGSCIVKALANDFESPYEVPCNKLKEDDISVTCPYSNKCGKMKRYRAIYSADVLVTTPYSLTKGKLKDFIDPYKRGIYELFHDLLDFIIVDEADGVQSTLDSELMPHGKLNYGDDNIINKVKQFRDEILDNNLKLRKKDVYSFSKNVSKIDSIMPSIIRIVLEFDKIQRYIQNKILTPTEIFNEVKTILEKVEGNEKFIDYLFQCVNLINIDNITEIVRDDMIYWKDVELSDIRKLGIVTLGAMKQYERIEKFLNFLKSWYLCYFSPDAARTLQTAAPQPYLNRTGHWALIYTWKYTRT